MTERKAPAKKAEPKKEEAKEDLGAYDMRHVSRPIVNDDPYDMTDLNKE